MKGRRAVSAWRPPDAMLGKGRRCALSGRFARALATDAAKGRLKVGDEFVHESIIGSEFEGRVEATTELGGYAAIIPSIAGWARTTGHNTIFVDERDPYWRGFQVG